MTIKPDELSPLQRRLKHERWTPLAYGHLACAIVARVTKYTGLYIAGKTPPKQPYMIGAAVAILFPAIECLSIRQYRTFMKAAVNFTHIRAGLGSEAKKAKWTTKIQGDGWKGYWIPFQDQLVDTKKTTAAEKVFDPSNIPLGTGCDMVVVAVHGGGYIDGGALMFLDYFRRLMMSAQKDQTLRIGILSIEYGLSPENPYPHAMNEIIASYRDLIKLHGVESKRIIFLGDSAGGNICLGTSLKLRDAFSELGSPAGQILICPWARSADPLESSLYDVVSAIGCEIYTEAYTQNDPETAMCTYTSPSSALSLTGLPPMLIFIGGVEILRPSIEQFVDRARNEGVDVKSVLGEGRSHNYFLLDDISTKQDREEALREMGEFVLRAHRQSTQATE
ncbi:alpha/beta hydrolase fold-domain-containing protein [Gamsiella multidivaricata]|uniref:alpha/beta hydrolase fold-domain-containing protein n=1 Tax=Gamsiella multidivaricata TaxID=101098 RepID=UPI002220B93D|nr:alpha/beta hydrolase fold-domain-containing protein [Gamsiella multidivaricata]KAG0367165.1 hypothetical protein BGZ54_004309 [Gamsiella multidivaricata]KAI7829801.1 alpha/beta hydrolase fold-domain-containing protein [Gamsiella multidivaricata]